MLGVILSGKAAEPRRDSRSFLLSRSPLFIVLAQVMREEVVCLFVFVCVFVSECLPGQIYLLGWLLSKEMLGAAAFFTCFT